MRETAARQRRPAARTSACATLTAPRRATVIAVIEDATAHTSTARSVAPALRRCVLPTCMQRQLEALHTLEALRDLPLDQTTDRALIAQALEREIGSCRQTRRQV